MGKSVIFLYSYHNMNTQKIGKVIAEKINASIIDVNTNSDIIDLGIYDLIGFGAGIGGGKHYSQMLKFAGNIPMVKNKKAFIFSTSGRHNKKKMFNDHKALRNILQSKGFNVIDEFGCKGFSYYNFKLIKTKKRFEMNKNRPNDEDLKNAEIFAEKLLNI